MSFIYKTLGSLTASDDPADAGDGRELSEIYTVIRSQVPAAAATTTNNGNAPSASENPGRIEFLSLSPAQSPSRSPKGADADDREEEESVEEEEEENVKEEEKLSFGSVFGTSFRFKSPMLKFHKEIVDFCDFVTATPDEQAQRSAAVKRVFEVIKYIWPHCTVEVFGSFQTGLYLPTSDVDVVVLNSFVSTPQTGLQALAKALSKTSVAKYIQVIGKARVPIIKFVEKQSNIAFDVSFNAVGGPEAAKFIKDAVAKLCPLRPLCLVLKVFLQQRGLNEVYTGGLGSYALITMIIAFIQMQWRGQDAYGGRTFVEHNLGVLLVKFFDFYGNKLNTWDVGISCKAGNVCFVKSSKGFVMSKCLISIEDPQEPTNDIGKSSFNYFQVRSAFATAYSLLTDPRTLASWGPNRSLLGLIIRPEPTLLSRRSGLDGRVTFSSLLPGAGDPINHLGDGGDMAFNWRQVDDDDDEPYVPTEFIERSQEIGRSRRKQKRSTEMFMGEKQKKKNKIKKSKTSTWDLEEGSVGKNKKKRQRRRSENGPREGSRRKRKSGGACSWMPF